MIQSTKFHRMDDTTGILTSIYHGKKEDIDELQAVLDRKSTMDVIKGMSTEEFAVLIQDLMHYDDPDYEWQSRLQPVLPFEDWKEWLYRNAEIRDIDDGR